MEYLIPLAYIVLGLIGGSFHYIKKRYIDETTQQSFWAYLKNDFRATKRATFTIITTEIALAAASGGVLGMNGIIGALTLGYSADSATNIASDAELVAAAKAAGEIFSKPAAPESAQPVVILKQEHKIEEIVNHDKKTSIADLLSADKSL
jgi:hypothetical protein